MLTQTQRACYTIQKTSENLEGTEGEETLQGGSSWHTNKKKNKNKANHKLIKWCKVLPSWNAEGELFGLASILPEGQMLSAGLKEWQSVLELVAKPDWKRRGRHRYTNSVYPTPPCR